MPRVSENLHGNVPDKCPVALLLVDVINPLDFPEVDQLLRHAVPAAERLAELKRAGPEGKRANDLRTTTSVGPVRSGRTLPGTGLQGSPAGRAPPSR